MSTQGGGSKFFVPLLNKSPRTPLVKGFVAVIVDLYALRVDPDVGSLALQSARYQEQD